MDVDDSYSHIMKEQLQLVKAETELNKMIKAINECLNELVVENLQLNASECDEMLARSTPSIPKDSKADVKSIVSVKKETPAEINMQQLNLNMNNKPYYFPNEEYESD